MKVIQLGEDAHQQWSKEFQCLECKSILEIIETDLEVINEGARYPGKPWQPNVIYTCVVCQRRNSVYGKIPAPIQNKVIAAAVENPG